MARVAFSEPVGTLESAVDITSLDSSPLVFPDGFGLFGADFEKSQQDLLVRDAQGTVVRVLEYFESLSPADLVSAEGGVLDGDTVRLLAGAAVDAQFAQLGPAPVPVPIGQVEVVSGSARVQRLDGTIDNLSVGTKIYQRDVLLTDADGRLSVTFADGTVFSMSEASRMVIDELVYQPEGTNNAGSFNLINGGFVFIAGQLAKTGDMDVSTPAATMGIRGTNVYAEVDRAETVTQVTVALNYDPDGSLGSIVLSDLDGNLITTITTTDTKWVIPVSGQVVELPRSDGEEMDESLLVGDALVAYQLAQERILAGQNYVEIKSVSSPLIQQNAPDDGTLPPSQGFEPEPEEPENNPNETRGDFDDTHLNIDNIRDPFGEIEPVDVVVSGPEDSGGSSPISGKIELADVSDDSIVFSLDKGPQNGTAKVNPDGTFVYTPEADFFGQDFFTYEIVDTTGTSATGTVTVEVEAVNDDPIAAPDTFVVGEDGSVAGSVLENDSDIEGDALAVVLTTAPTHGTLTMLPDGRFTYAPDANFTGTDSFVYTVSDGNGGADTATVTVTVTGVNDAPVAVDDTVSVAEDGSVSIAVLGNDSDPDGDSLTVSGASDPANGSVVVNADNTLSYTPDANFNGTDTFTYTVSDGNGGADTATVTVTVTGVNDAPVAVDDTVSVAEDGSVSIAVLGNDSDPDGDSLTVSGASDPANGSVVVNADNTLSYTPDANFNGTDTFTYTVSDGNGGADTATVTVTVTGVNDAPVAVDDTVSVAEDGSVSIAVLGNDSDPDGDSLVVSGASDPANGSVVVNADNTLSYTPDANFNGTDTFTYTVSDGNGGSDTGTVTVTVTGVNDAPVGNADSATTEEDTPVTIAVLANDGDREGDSLSIASFTQPEHGSITVNGDGTVTYSPDENYNGPDSFTYVLTDGAANSAPVSVSLLVGVVNDPPSASDDAVSTLEDTPVSIAVLGNDSDPDGDSLTVSSVGFAANGSVVVNADNTLSYTPDADFNGTDTFTYTVSDGNGDIDTATVTVTVTGVNDAPVAVDDTVSVAEDGSVSIAVLGNDSDPDGDSLTVSGASDPANGSVVVNADNTLSYTPDANFTGTDSFVYTVSDGNGGADTATVTVTVTGVNDAPVAVDDTVSVAEDGSVSIAVLGNDSDPDGDSLVVSGASDPANGSVVVNADNTLSYTPDADFNGTDTFTYTVSDGNGDIDTATVTVTVTGVNDAPVAVDDTVSVAEDGSVSIAVLGNDSDPDGDSLVVSGASDPANGSVVVNADNTLSYTPDANFTGTDSFVYTVSDGNGGADTATVTVTVTGVNDAPVAVDDTVSVAEDGSVSIAVLGNDSDPDGDSLVVSGASDPANGSVVVNADNTLSYTPDANFNGTDTFTYTVSDGNGDIDTATVTVTVTGVNDAPVAVDDTVSVAEDGSVSIAVLGNDSDPDGDSLTVSRASDPANGSVVVKADNTLSYTPDANFNGTDTFTYTVSDGNGGADTATVTVTVTGVNDAPVVASTINVQTNSEDDGFAGIVAPDFFQLNNRANDVDDDDDPSTLTYQYSNFSTTAFEVTTGGLQLNIAGNFDHLAVGESTQATATVVATDSHGAQSNEGTLIWTITGVNDDPTLAAGTLLATEDGGAVSLNLATLGDDVDSDDDANSLTYAVTGQPSEGSATVNGTMLTFDPGDDFQDLAVGETQQVSIQVTATDSHDATAVNNVTVTVTGVNDAPVATNFATTVTEDSGANAINVFSNVSDVDGDDLEIVSVSTAGSGTVVVMNNGTPGDTTDDFITYQPSADFNGVESISYTVSDGNGGSDTGTITVTVEAVNDPPVANDDTFNGTEDQPITGSVLTNDTDDGDINPAPLVVSSYTQPGNGTVTVASNGSFTYTPSQNFSGQDSFTYTVVDGVGATDTATVILNLAEANDDPVAKSDFGITDQGEAVTINVVANDEDEEGDTLTVTSVGGASNGTVSFSGGTVTYTPNANFDYGVDSFTYTVSDGNGGTDSSTVTVLVEQDVSTLPTGLPVSITFNPETPGEPPGSFFVNVIPVSSNSINLVIAMDSSGSITLSGWNDMKEAVEGALSELKSQFDNSITDVNVSLISYSSGVQQSATYDLVDQYSSLITALDGLPFQAGNTNWEAAFDASKAFFVAQSDGVNILYFITDGNPVPTNQEWQEALSELNASVSVDIEAFAIGPQVDLGNLNQVDSDGSATTVTSPSALATAFSETPLFNAQLVDFSLELYVDGTDLGEIADEDSDAVSSNGLNYTVTLEDVPGIDDMLGEINVFTATAIFDLDGVVETTSDRIELFAGGVIQAEPEAGASSGSAVAAYVDMSAVSEPGLLPSDDTVPVFDGGSPQGFGQVEETSELEPSVLAGLIEDGNDDLLAALELPGQNSEVGGTVNGADNQTAATTPSGPDVFAGLADIGLFDTLGLDHELAGAAATA
ncbi:tandem-95 repeat protein [Ruegeria pomeroyi]|nr:tandem-95 repeat protein [Ruegeria pomeroyi]